MWALPLTATIVSALFSGIVFRQYLERLAHIWLFLTSSPLP